MAIAANTRIKLDAHSPKKDSVVDTPGTAPTGTEVAIWARAAVPTGTPQSVVGGFEQLRRYALTQMVSMDGLTDPHVVHMALGAGEPGIEIDGTPTTTEISIEIGATLAAKSQSHFVDRTVTRLIERWLEASKTG